jgi:O-antigen/teichoic acid export membrane protein
MNSPSSLTRMASPLVVGRLASAAVTFALPLLLARALDPSGFGTYKQLFLVAQTVLLTCQFGLTQSLYYFLPRERAGRGAYVAQSLLLLGVLAALAGVALCAAAPLLSRHLGDGALGGLALPLGLLASGMLLASPLEGALTSEGRVGTAAVCYVASDAARAAALLLGARGHGIAGVAWGAAAWAGARVVGLTFALTMRAIPLARPNRAALKTQLAYAIPFAGSVWLYVAQKQFIQYAIASRFDAATFALFSVAAFHLPAVDILYTPISDVLIVQLGRAQSARSAERLAAWDDAVEKLASLLWPATACAFLFGGALLPLLFTQRYAASVPLFLITSLEIPLWVLPVDALLRAAGQTRFLFAWYGARVLLTGAVVLGGLRWGGLGGAIAGGVVSEAISRIVMAARGRSLLGVTLARTLDPALARVALASVVAALPALGVRLVVHGRAGLGAGIAAYGATYLALRLGVGLRPRRARTLDAAAAAT